MITAVWSNDPEFYNVITGGSDILEHIFVKVNYSDTHKIVARFNLKEISKNIYVRSDGYKYICVKDETVESALKLIKETKQKLA